MLELAGLRARDGVARCIFCRQKVPLGARAWSCPGCGTLVHAECTREMAGQGCPTLGCSSPPPWATSPAELAGRAGRRRRGRLLAAGLALTTGVGTGLAALLLPAEVARLDLRSVLPGQHLQDPIELAPVGPTAAPAPLGPWLRPSLQPAQAATGSASPEDRPDLLEPDLLEPDLVDADGQVRVVRPRGSTLIQARAALPARSDAPGAAALARGPDRASGQLTAVLRVRSLRVEEQLSAVAQGPQAALAVQRARVWWVEREQVIRVPVTRTLATRADAAEADQLIRVPAGAFRCRVAARERPAADAGGVETVWTAPGLSVPVRSTSSWWGPGGAGRRVEQELIALEPAR